MNTDEFSRRRQRLLDAIGSDGIAIVPAASEQLRNRDVHYPFRQDSDFHYLTGFPEPDAVAVFAPGSEHGDYLLFCRPRDPEREIWDGRRAGPAGAVETYGADAAWTLAELDEQILPLLGRRRQIWFALGAQAGADQRLIGWINRLRGMSRQGLNPPDAIMALESVLHEMRLVKSAAEIELMRHAAKISAAAHCRAMRVCEPGRHEFELAANIHEEFALHGMEPAYGTIVGGGANACVLHYVENSAPLAPGTLCLIDAGAEHQGYSADITRTFPVSGQYSGEQRAVYEVVLAAQLAAIEQVRPGNPWDAPHQAAVRAITSGLKDLGVLQGDVDALIEDESYSPYFMHKTGHWLGRDVHDVGRYKVDGDWRPLQAGMALTIEPGLYFAAGRDGVPGRFADIGVRIEDDCVVTDTGVEVLTADVPKAADEIEALMA